MSSVGTEARGEPAGSIYTEANFLWLERIGSFGSFPPYARIVAQTDPKIAGLLLRPDDPLVNASRMAEVRSKGLKAGVAFGTAFPADPIAAAKATSDVIGVLNADYVFLDQEMHSYDWIYRFHFGDTVNGVARKGYRGSGGQENGQGLRSGKATDFSCEGGQDGSWGDPRGSIYPVLIRNRIGIVRQPYLGDMTPIDFDTTRDWVLTSAPASFRMMRACYDPKPGLPGRISGGCIFYAERWGALWSGTARLLRKHERAIADTQKRLDAHRALAAVIGDAHGKTAASGAWSAATPDMWARAAWWERSLDELAL